uniref:Uncharacterized protein n=1 Tax=Leersia perrieri TaxID=77586 RepID=A0A0D9XLB0_9ORYZ
MSMAISRLLWAFRSASYLNISTFPMAAIADLLKKELLQLGNDFNAKQKRLASYVPMIQAVLTGAGKTPLSEQQKIWLTDLKDTNLRGQLQGRRFLLVLDDCWEENWHNWEKLQHPLLNGAVGSKIIVTARSSAVARVLGPSKFYQLRSLPDEDCWLLFRQYAQAYPLNCRLIKEQVIRKCKGIPFIAASLGHKVRLEEDRRKWASILQGEDWSSNSNDFKRALQLSYEQLDSHLKPCFAYSSIVSQKFQFEEEWLIQLWMAQGLIQPNPNSNEPMEDTGRSYFSTLVEQSFFQRAHITGEQHSYCLSWMMHDLALGVSAEECHTMEGSCTLPEQVRHLTVVFRKEIATNLFEKIPRSESLHTLIIMGGSSDFSMNIPDDLGVRFARLRALDFSNFGISDLPESIGKLKHLRCLQLRGTKIKCLPESICSLYNLQTLGLRDCYELSGLPGKISNISKLRHIDLAMTCNPCQYVCSLRCMPKGIGSLTDLQTLSRFVISQRRTDKTDISELANLNNLHGQLIISNLHLVKDSEEALQARLASKQFLKKLELSWGDKVRQTEQILERLNPSSSIEELTISGYSGITCPSWLWSPDYRNLVTMRLYDFKNCNVVPPLGQLPKLENLHLKGWSGLTSMNCSNFCGRSTDAFQSLKKLHFEKLDNFQIWGGSERCAFPALLELVLENCSNLEKLTHYLPSLTKITVEGSLKFDGLWNFPSLKYVNVIASGEWIWKSWGSLSSPISITLCALPTVEFPLGLGWTHPSLQCLEISHCESLKYIPKDWPPRNLNHLSVKHCSQLRELPSGIRRLQALEDIEIIDCPGLTRLPDMDGLTSLLRLEISDCGSILCLPRLPSSVQFLSINKCPQLSSSCKNEHSEDHWKINRIFSVWIDGDQVFSSADEPRFVIPAKLQ